MAWAGLALSQHKWVLSGSVSSTVPFRQDSGIGNAADLYLPGISLSFSFQINARDLFQTLSRLGEVAVVAGGGWKNTKQMRKFFRQLFLPAAAIYRFN